MPPRPATLPLCPTATTEPRGRGVQLAGLCMACGRATIHRDQDGHPRHQAGAA